MSPGIAKTAGQVVLGMARHGAARAILGIRIPTGRFELAQQDLGESDGLRWVRRSRMMVV
jgi:hypothetical protein